MNRHWLAVGLFSLVLAVPALADDPPANPADAAKAAEVAQPAANPVAAAMAHVMLSPKDLKWVEAPAGLPKGAKVAVLHGDPAAPAIFAMRIQMPAGYKVMPHYHPADEQVTVISGDLSMAEGDSWDDSKGHKMGPGGFSLMPQGVHHYAWSKSGAVIQIHAMGPWAITYLNPADDPRNMKEAAK